MLMLISSLLVNETDYCRANVFNVLSSYVEKNNRRIPQTGRKCYNTDS